MAQKRVAHDEGVPQECPACKESLADPSVPPEYEMHRHLFSLVLSDGPDWLCPKCGHRWSRPR